LKKKNTIAMKKLLTLFFTVFIATTFYAQGDYQDLLIIKADGDWEQLIKKAERYTMKGSTEDDAVPYYYLAYGLYKISFIGDRDEEYDNAFKDALTAIGKMLKKDETGEVQEKYAEFINEIKMNLLELIQNEFGNDEYRRAFGWVMRLYKFGRDYPQAKFLEGVCRYRNTDKATARMKWKEGQELLENSDPTSWGEADKKLMMIGLYESAKVLKESRQNDRAKEFMNLGAPYFEDNEQWQTYYDEIVNS
tara:strand:- start:10727 stop:11473 length:747 start_codon:yes stop_codon:yes gene_type:complete